MVMPQVATIVLPITRAGTLTIADALQHISLSLNAVYLQEKIAYVYATMVGAPGRLDAWVEVAPTDVATSYVRLGAVQSLVATGNVVLPWTAHSAFARVILQAPLLAAGAWVVVVLFEGKT